MDRFADAWEARDWDRIAGGFAPGFRIMDRRKMVRIELDRGGHLESLRPMFEMRSSGFTGAVLATRGDRLALERFCFEASGRTVGPIEVEFLQVTEVDDRGDRVALVVLDPDDLDAAYAELDARYAAGEAAPYAASWEMYVRQARAQAARDWEQVAAYFAPDCVLEDHRPLGLPTLRSRDECVASIRAFADLRPDARARTEHVLALDDRRMLLVTGWVGSEAEGRFDIPVVAAVGLSPDGHTERVDIYNLDQLDEAWARFAALRPDPLRIPPNAASRARDRALEAFAARDWPALRALTSRDMVWEDRQKHALLTGDVELWISSFQHISGVRLERELIATVGDWIALERGVWTGGPAGGEFEIEVICLTEIDAGGRLRASLNFDLDDRRAAFAEAQARFVAGEAAAIGGQAPLLAVYSGLTGLGWLTRLRGYVAHDVVVHDHRTLGLGVLSGDEFGDSLRALTNLAPDVHSESIRILAWNRHGRVDLGRIAGTMPHGGGPFENVLLRVIVTDGDRIQHVEFFDVGDADRALARFEELCAARMT
jgi:hypothetical protein